MDNTPTTHNAMPHNHFEVINMYLVSPKKTRRPTTPTTKASTKASTTAQCGVPFFIIVIIQTRVCHSRRAQQSGHANRECKCLLLRRWRLSAPWGWFSRWRLGVKMRACNEDDEDARCVPEFQIIHNFITKEHTAEGVCWCVCCRSAHSLLGRCGRCGRWKMCKPLTVDLAMMRMWYAYYA